MNNHRPRPSRPTLRRSRPPFELFVITVSTFGLALPLVWIVSPGHVRNVNRRRLARYQVELAAWRNGS